MEPGLKDVAVIDRVDTIGIPVGHRSRSRSRAVVVMLILSCLSSACADVSMAPYRRPETVAKPGWSRVAPVSAGETIQPEWWKGFGDPELERLIRMASGSNTDLKVLAARIRIAGAQVGEARAGALPTADFGTAVSFDKSTGRPASRQFSVAAALNWEIDVWGKVAAGVSAQNAEYRASEADWRAGYLRTVSDVATTYFQILQFDEQIVQQEQTRNKNRQILAILDSMAANGLLPSTRVLQQRAEINRLSNDLIELHRSRDLGQNALATLLGAGAGEFHLPAGRLQERVRLPEVPAGLPSALLKRRPDIVAAEFRVLEAYDLVGQAKLAQLPSISLTGRGGSSSFALTDLLRAFTFNLLPSINIPLLDPATRARVHTRAAQSELAEAQYRQTVMTAFAEVEDALVNLDAHQRQRSELQQQIAHLTTVASQVEAQLREGLVSQLDVFESQRSLLTARQALLTNHQQVLSDTVTIYKALGGGWTDVLVGQAEPADAARR